MIKFKYDIISYLLLKLKKMKRFLGFLIKEFYHIFRDRRTMLILFGMPIVQVLLFGYVITNEIKNVRIAIIDHSRDEVTNKLTNKILSSGYFVLDSYLNSEKEIGKAFRKGTVNEVVIFESEFSKKYNNDHLANIHIVADATDPNLANLIVSYTQGIVQEYVSADNALMPQPMKMNTTFRMFFNEGLKSVYMFVPGIMTMILMLISAMMTSISIAREKELGTMEILLVSPLRPLQIIMGKVTPYFLLSFTNSVVILLLGVFVFKVPIQGNLILLLAECMLFILLALTLGIFISTTAKNQQAAMMASMFGLMLPTILLSGFIYPIENMPLPLQILSNAMPPKWFNIILKNIMLKGTGIAFVWKETLVLIGMIILFTTLSVKKFKIRLE